MESPNRDLFRDIKPMIIVSRCLGIDHCRWNGDMVNDSFVNLLKEYVDFFDVCPEADIGLGVPRNPVRLVKTNEEGKYKLVQPATGRDCTSLMQQYSSDLLSKISEADGFLLKYASPSCGLNNIKVYSSAEKGSPIARSSGMFAVRAQENFPLIPFEDEGRLHNYILRENWLIAIFTIANFRTLKATKKMSALYDFHSQYKYLFMSYSQNKMRQMGHILANHDKHPVNEVYNEYLVLLKQLLALSPSIPRRINVLLHMMGYFSDHLKKEEKQYFINLLEEYRRGAMPLKVPLEIIKSWALRFDNQYILKQKILQPYPPELLILSDSGKGRNLKR